MTRRDVLIVGAWAASAFGVTAALLWPAALNATDQPTTRPEIATPTLSVNGAQLSIRQVNGANGARLELVAVNNGKADAQVNYAVQLQDARPPDYTSRVAIPRTLSRQADQTVVKAGETRVIELKADPALAKVAGANVVLASGNQRIVATHIAPAVKPAK